jgi:hypothetical protein
MGTGSGHDSQNIESSGGLAGACTDFFTSLSNGSGECNEKGEFAFTLINAIAGRVEHFFAEVAS